MHRSSKAGKCKTNNYILIISENKISWLDQSGRQDFSEFFGRDHNMLAINQTWMGVVVGNSDVLRWSVFAVLLFNLVSEHAWWSSSETILETTLHLETSELLTTRWETIINLSRKQERIPASIDTRRTQEEMLTPVKRFLTFPIFLCCYRKSHWSPWTGLIRVYITGCRCAAGWYSF